MKRGTKQHESKPNKEIDASSKQKSPAMMMAEANVLAQQAAIKQVDHLWSMIEVQKEEMQLRKHDSELQWEEHQPE
jgi:hypothetical protein